MQAKAQRAVPRSNGCRFEIPCHIGVVRVSFVLGSRNLGNVGFEAAMEDDFAIFTEEDKRHFAYRACVMTSVAIGATLGSYAAGTLTLPGAFGGAVFGFYACKTVDEALKRKYLDTSVRMSPEEFRRLAVQTASSNPRLSRVEVLDLLGQVRQMSAKSPTQYRC